MTVEEAYNLQHSQIVFKGEEALAVVEIATLISDNNRLLIRAIDFNGNADTYELGELELKPVTISKY